MEQSNGKKNLEKIIPIRVSVENWGQIKKEADRMGIGVSTLTRIWIMESLQKLPKHSSSGVGPYNRRINGQKIQK